MARKPLFALILLLSAAFLLGFGTVEAQEVTATPSAIEEIESPPPGDTTEGVFETEPDPSLTDPEVVGELIIKLITGMVQAAFAASPITVIVVSLLKRVRALENVSSPTLVFIVSAVIWIAVTLAEFFGYQQQATSVVELLENTLPSITAFVLTLIGAPVIHEVASNMNVAVLGYKRPPTTTRPLPPIAPIE